MAYKGDVVRIVLMLPKKMGCYFIPCVDACIMGIYSKYAFMFIND